MHLLRLLRQYLKPYTWYVVFVLILQTLSTLAVLYLPTLNARIIDKGVATGDIGYIWSTGGVMVGVALVQVVTAIVATWFGARAAMGVGHDIRRDVYRTVDAYSAEDIGKFGTPTLITRGTNDVQQVQMVLLMILNFMVMAPIMSIGGIIMAVREDVHLSWLLWVSVPVLLIVVGFLVSRLVPMFTAMQDKIDTINEIMREQITGIRVVRAFVREDHEAQRFAAANRDITDISVRIGRVFVLMFPVITLILHLATAAVLWFGGHRVDDGLMQVGSLTAFMQYLLQILVAVMMGTFMAMMLPRAIVCAERINEVFDNQPSIADPASPVVPARSTGTVEFNNVTFAYPGAESPVLRDVSFTAKPGQTVAIIGATGAGKSTLINLIPRLYSPTSGRVLIDGVDVRDLSRQDLAQRVGLVPQKAFLFSGTVADNLRFGNREATESDLWDALRIAQAEDFVRTRTTGEGETTAHGLESSISQGGTDVSGGQRQRLSIARALVAQPRLFLFDDSFSALDVKTDATLRRALRSHTGDAVVLMVAQRVSTIAEADLILVMEAGRIVARGTHEELLQSSATYQEIVRSQLSAEEAS
ncbi:ABC transporter ATP-binding protein [Corynebacterium auriscanis]|uniref:Multidrug ABC transporter ATPase n=1 Tax=Corynebacterium auriscanis TaxID=99807 RepID=A0A0A2DJF0_9CORY|nr:ABC transporter ATP-binding protein [Corynebacterium auriscanis]KGM18004.1 multidrug ABC transporter ATPase [Corynebacterium auriscanis]WJY71962.1 putative ABC transporter ATP-binding protein [Corynebacterium auriscanis]